ncbi:MAG: thioredoxin domain-containing protein [Gammaproteobacteria bacterium]|nr:thioredoxin domain-containing protein [Gammaproteobacteria bacterium]
MLNKYNHSLRTWRRCESQFVLFVVLCLPWAAHALSNQLKNHPSPYLALHAEDPVAWQDWSQATVERARKENKLLFISIGYFSCHWCHVMQKESYRNKEIASYINKNFIPVKVDRELQPTLDARMIDFVERTRGRGGWPLNVFVTPNGHPLYGALYMPPEQFMSVLKRLGDLWKEDPKSLMDLAQADATQGQGPGKPELDRAQVKAYALSAVGRALQLGDEIYGGFGDQTKFPSTPQLEFLLDQLAAGGSEATKLKSFLVLTFDHMADYGLYDHVGEGFFRYTVDPEWQTPHFEKMLYDNAQLARVFRRAAQVLGQKRYTDIADRTLQFLMRAMRAPSGAYYASLSALDDKGIEGGYYLWDSAQLGKLLNASENQAFRLAWSVRDAPPFDGGYLPILGQSVKDIAKTMGLSEAQVQQLLLSAKQKLKAAQAKRKLPIDIKLLAAWNGLALSAFAEAAAQTGNKQYRQAAQDIRNFLMNRLWDGSELKRSVTGKNHRAIGKAAVEDYAYVAEGLLNWAELTTDKKDLANALAVTEQAWKRFYTPQGWRMGEDSLIGAETGSDVLFDGPMPSPSGIILHTSLRLAKKTGDKELRRRTLGALNSGHDLMRDNPFWFASQIRAMTVAQ